MSDENSGPWVLVLDNVDDTDILSGQHGHTPRGSFAELLPRTRKFLVLITSRGRKEVDELVEYAEDIIDVEAMDEKSPMELLKSRAQILESSKPSVKKLVQKLGYFPLAVVQAASYIHMTYDVTVEEYLELIDGDGKEGHQIDLLKTHEAGGIRRTLGAENSIIKTIQRTFDRIRLSHSSATDLISLMSVLDGPSIPESLLVDNVNNQGLKVAIGILLGYSLVMPNKESKSFQMHGIIQLTMRDWLDSQSELARWEAESIRRVAKTFPVANFENLQLCRALLPHSRRVINYVPRTEEATELWMSWLSIERKASLCLGYIGDYRAAEEISQKELYRREKILGAKNKDTLLCKQALALILRYQGRLDESKELYLFLMKAGKESFGIDDQFTRGVISNLVGQLIQEEQFLEAEAVNSELAEVFRSCPSPADPCMLSYMTDMATIKLGQEKFEEAEALFERIVEVSLMLPETERHCIVDAKSQLAFIYHKRGQSAKAISLMEEIRHRYLTFGGADDPWTKSVDAVLEEWQLENGDRSGKPCSIQ